MSRIIIVSNRLPAVVEKREGILHFRQSIGKLTTGLVSFYKAPALKLMDASGSDGHGISG